MKTKFAAVHLVCISYSHINLASYQKPYLNLLPTVAITNGHNNKWFYSVHVKEHRHGV